MPSLYPDQLDDFVNLTLQRYERKNWSDISLQYQNYIFADRIIQADRMQIKGGQFLEWKVKVKNLGSARHTGLYSVDQVNQGDLTKKATSKWSMQTANWSYDVQEDDMQSDAETIIREVDIRENGMWDDFFELMEVALWSAPASDTEDPRKPNGIPFWFPKYTSATPAFQGGNPSGFTGGAGGLSSTQFPRWSSWAGQYLDVSNADLLQKVRDACWNTNFKAPIKFAELSSGAPQTDWDHFTTQRVTGRIERIMQSRNDNLGPDVMKYAGGVLVAGNPVTAVAYLQANDTSDPWYGVCWKYFIYYVKSGYDQRLQPPKQSPRQHNVRERHLDHTGNFAVTNRRNAGFCLSK